MNNEITLHTSDEIYVAAADSAETDKQLAEYVCTGTDDQDVIQAAVDSVYERTEPERRGARIILLPGNYYIDAFPRANANGRVAVMVRSETNRYAHLAILITGAEHAESTFVHVTEKASDSVGENESCSVFGCEKHNWNHHVFKDIYVTVFHSQKTSYALTGA